MEADPVHAPTGIAIRHGGATSRSPLDVDDAASRADVEQLEVLRMGVRLDRPVVGAGALADRLDVQEVELTSASASSSSRP